MENYIREKNTFRLLIFNDYYSFAFIRVSPQKIQSMTSNIVASIFCKKKLGLKLIKGTCDIRAIDANLLFEIKSLNTDYREIS